MGKGGKKGLKNGKWSEREKGKEREERRGKER